MRSVSDGDDEGQSSGEGSQPPKFVYECVRCGHSCEDRNFVEVTLEDLRTWAKDQTLASLFPHLRLMSVGRPYLDVVLASDEGLRAFEAGDREYVGCPLYDRENHLCNIYSSMPLYCRAFPLAWNGNSYFIKDRECQGIGKGSMTAERLAAHREDARRELEARRETGILMPTLQGVFTRFFVEASARTLEAMTPDDRSKLEELMAKQVERSVRGTVAEEPAGPEEPKEPREGT
jgi:Fe-S-cluster containining protein